MKKIILISIIIFSLSSCYNDKEELVYPQPTDECTGVNASYIRDIYPIMISKCAIPSCHTSVDVAGNIVLETYIQAAANSEGIYQECILTNDMPIGNSLTQDEIKSIQCWLLSGTPNN